MSVAFIPVTPTTGLIPSIVCVLTQIGVLPELRDELLDVAQRVVVRVELVRLREACSQVRCSEPLFERFQDVETRAIDRIGMPRQRIEDEAGITDSELPESLNEVLHGISRRRLCGSPMSVLTGVFRSMCGVATPFRRIWRKSS